MTRYDLDKNILQLHISLPINCLNSNYLCLTLLLMFSELLARCRPDPALHSQSSGLHTYVIIDGHTYQDNNNKIRSTLYNTPDSCLTAYRRARRLLVKQAQHLVAGLARARATCFLSFSRGPIFMYCIVHMYIFRRPMIRPSFVKKNCKTHISNQYLKGKSETAKQRNRPSSP